MMMFLKLQPLNDRSLWTCTIQRPLIFSSSDLFSLMMFLKLQPLNDRSFWTRTIQRPLLSGERSGFSRLQAALMHPLQNKKEPTRGLVAQIIFLWKATFASSDTQIRSTLD